MGYSKYFSNCKYSNCTTFFYWNIHGIPMNMERSLGTVTRIAQVLIQPRAICLSLSHGLITG